MRNIWLQVASCSKQPELWKDSHKFLLPTLDWVAFIEEEKARNIKTDPVIKAMDEGIDLPYENTSFAFIIQFEDKPMWTAVLCKGDYYELWGRKGLRWVQIPTLKPSRFADPTPLTDREKAVSIMQMASMYHTAKFLVRSRKTVAYISSGHRSPDLSPSLRDAYSYHIITIGPEVHIHQNRGEPLHRWHNRQHDVRGHWRTYADGHKTWIPAHKRGDPTLGIIDKEYHVK